MLALLHAEPCNGQVSRCREADASGRGTGFTLLWWLSREFRKVTRSHSASRSPWNLLYPSHSLLTAASPAHSPRPESIAAARSTARLARRSPSHSQLPAITGGAPPTPAAGRHGSHSPRPAITRRSPPRPIHSLRPASFRWRRCPPSLAAARLTDSVTRHSGTQAVVYVVRIWNTLMAIFGTP